MFDEKSICQNIVKFNDFIKIASYLGEIVVEFRGGGFYLKNSKKPLIFEFFSKVENYKVKLRVP
jgi:hypothetical protein